MCRIASLFLLQRLKGSMSGDARDFNNLETRAIIKFFFSCKAKRRRRCRSSEQLLEFFRSDPNDFLSRLVAMDETWLYHYDPETNQQSMEWRHSGSLRPKNSEGKNPLEKFSPRFFGIKTAFSSLIIFQRAKLSTRSITHLCWCN